MMDGVICMMIILVAGAVPLAMFLSTKDEPQPCECSIPSPTVTYDANGHHMSCGRCERRLA